MHLHGINCSLQLNSISSRFVVRDKQNKSSIFTIMKGEFILGLILKIGVFSAVFPISEAELPQHNFLGSYDFIVVGSGVAGCTVARRLSENGQHTVLLLEVGGYPDPKLDIPALVPGLLLTPEFIKRYPTVPQKNIAQQNGGIVLFPTGRVVGGGSSDNGMVFNRGNPLDYANWANITGDPSWSYANMLPYMKRVEDYHGKFPLTDQHGVGGPITISTPNYAPGLEEWLRAGHSLGYPVVDSNGPQLQQDSFTPLDFSKRFGRRVSSYTGYIAPVISHLPNLKLITRADVRRILFERHDGNKVRATGVLYVTTSPQNISSLVKIQARKEVIISAGVIGSPTLLLRSGVGPLEALTEARVPIIKLLPVGENIHDQVKVQMDFIIRNTTEVFDPSRDLNPQTWQLYNEIADGPYSNKGDTAQAFFSSSQTSVAWPDIQLQLVWTPGLSSTFKSNVKKEDLGPGETTVFCQAALTRPRSRGTLTLNTTNIDEDPVIDFRYLEDPRDEIALIDAINKTLTIFEKATIYQNMGARYNPRPFSACQHLLFRSVEYWRCFIKQTGVSWFHAAGSCKMGRVNSPDSVLDSQLQVIGISGLRVIDASVKPAITNANNQAPIYAIAEKVSDIILRKWNNYANF